MRAPGDILLVSCYEPGHQPQGLATAVAALREAGYQPACLDLAVEPFDAAASARLATARLIALSVPMHTALTLGLRVAERARHAAPHAHVCFFGLYASLNAALLRTRGDSVLGPDAEASLVAIADALSRGEPPPVAVTSPRAPDRVVARVPARDALPALARYARLATAGEERTAGHAETTRGCKHMCRHCPIPPVYGGRFFAVPAEVVLADVRGQVASGARHIDFGDPDFLNGPTHALRVARALHDEHPGVTFSFTTKIEHILRHRDAFPELAALGANFVVSAVESLSDRVLAALDKGHRAADVAAALAVVRGAGMSLRPTFVAFTPWTTLDDYLELCRFIRANALEHEVDPVQLSIRLLVPPGSLLLGTPELGPFVGELDPGALSYQWTHPDPRMRRLEADIAALVELAVGAGERPASTFARIHRRASEAAGVSTGDLDERPSSITPAALPPRLTEHWFCCAQPTQRQLGVLRKV